MGNEASVNAVKGIIHEIIYWGSFYTVEINVGNEMVSMQVRKPGYKKGDLVYLTLSEDAVWYL